MEKEQEQKPTLSDLLALRDGETGDAGLAATVQDDAALSAELVRLQQLKSELAALPTVTPDPAVWQAIQERSRFRAAPWLQRHPLATAASIFVAAALGVMVLWNPTTRPVSPSSGAQAAADPVAQLMLRSRHLESELFTRASAPVTRATTSEQALIYGIADVDDQLNELSRSGSADPGERERLWRQRVMLLESLADIQRGEAALRPAIY